MIKVIGIIFTILYLFLGFFLGVVGSVHGPGLLVVFSIMYSIIATAGLWAVYFFIKKRDFKRNNLIFFAMALGIGVILLGAINFSWSPLLYIENIRIREQQASTEVFDMRDEVYFSPSGNPMGIRLKYSMRFPVTGYFWQHPSVVHGEYSNINMRLVNIVSEPPMIGKDPSKFEKGIVYNFIVDMIPYFIGQDLDTKKPCISKPRSEYINSFEKLIHNDSLSVKYKIGVSGTKYSSTTENTYNPALFYNSAIQEGVTECRVYD